MEQLMQWRTEKRRICDLIPMDSNPRYLTEKQKQDLEHSIAEARRVLSFPDDFRFVGGWKEAIKCMGNSVSPNLMRAIAEHIKEKLLLTKSNE